MRRDSCRVCGGTIGKNGKHSCAFLRAAADIERLRKERDDKDARIAALERDLQMCTEACRAWMADIDREIAAVKHYIAENERLTLERVAATSELTMARGALHSLLQFVDPLCMTEHWVNERAALTAVAKSALLREPKP